MKPPRPADVLAARNAAGLTQPAAAAVVHSTARAWAAWESQTKNKRQMPTGLFELFLIKTGQQTTV